MYIPKSNNKPALSKKPCAYLLSRNINAKRPITKEAKPTNKEINPNSAEVKLLLTLSELNSKINPTFIITIFKGSFMGSIYRLK